MLRVELVEELYEKAVSAAALKLCAESQVELCRKPLILPLKLLDQVFVQRH